MYQEEYKRWLAADLEDADLKPELSKIEGNDDEIKERFAVALKFGTAGLRGVLGAGTNRMNIYVVRQATQGLANWVKTQGGTQTVAISYDSRLKSDVFAKTAAGVLAANGIKVRIYDALMPVPALSFATRYYNCNAGVMVTASHNPAKYNGYKAYGPDGCQMTDDAAAIVYEEIQKTDVLTGAKYMSFAEGVEEGLIRFVGDDCKRALYDAIESRQVRPGLCKTAGLKLVYSPLNGSDEDGVASTIKEGTVVCDMSSVTPVESKECYEGLKDKGVGFVDAPVSGGEPGAVAGTLAIMAGGDQEDFDAMKEYFDILGSSALLIGGSGSGSVTKLANQVIVNNTIAVVSEAFVLATKAGADPEKVYHAIRGGLAGSAVLDAKIPMIIERNFKPGGPIRINHKDIKNVVNTAHSIDVPIPYTAQLYEILQTLKIHGHMNDDHGGIVQYFEKLADVEVKKTEE